MEKLVITSMRQNAGKTSMIIGLAKALNKRLNYIKPFGDNILYRKKRLWDYDAALIASILNLEEAPEDMSIGFNHSRLLYILDRESTNVKVNELLSCVSRDVDMIFVESGKDISYGVSVYLDAISLASFLDAKLLVVISGNEETVLDDIMFLMNHINIGEATFKGVILNKIPNAADFVDIHLPKIKLAGINILGVIPYYDELTKFSVNYLADRLFAKVITCESHLNRVINKILIGSMSVSAAKANPLFYQENKVIITSGDRSDMINAAMENNTAAIILTNNILPPQDIISKATELEIPLLLVTSDTYSIAKQIDSMEPLLTKDDESKITLIEQIIRRHVNLNEFQ
ncbi:MAG: DRTGG domain-containing protein [Deltaproteobacteria bacterium]|nr:DRTGG domain-containing protein [Deltaproteobacteria bacterium]